VHAIVSGRSRPRPGESADVEDRQLIVGVFVDEEASGCEAKIAERRGECKEFVFDRVGCIGHMDDEAVAAPVRAEIACFKALVGYAAVEVVVDALIPPIGPAEESA
jgi:hypothetical protein